MCTPRTITSLVRWRVRDWASCFLACRFPIVDEANRHCHSRQEMKNSNIDTRKGGCRDNDAEPKLLRQGKKCNISRSSQRHDSNIDMVPVEGQSGKMSFNSDGEYIVFSFHDDGKIDVVNGGELQVVNIKDTKLKVVNEDSLNLEAPEIETMSPSKTGNGIISNHDHQKDEENEKENYLDMESSFGGINNFEEHNKVVLDVCTDSKPLDARTSSFAFPVLGWEWIGSPEQMPKSDQDQQMRRPKSRCLVFQCFRF